ncbi:MAG: type II toxin-antitoxin system Phd/YefM family antitoxin [Burkholderiaceae bacterium]|nr:type II toxin-antitoxin system Phd/YefM family antitoxin [Burkholderiaceae bacterium]
MHEIGAFEAKNKLSALLDLVAQGEEVVITRHGKPVARMVPAVPSFDRAKARQAAQGLSIPVWHDPRWLVHQGTAE